MKEFRLPAAIAAGIDFETASRSAITAYLEGLYPAEEFSIGAFARFVFTAATRSRKPKGLNAAHKRRDTTREGTVVRRRFT